MTSLNAAAAGPPFPNFPTPEMLADLGDAPDGAAMSQEDYERTVTEFRTEWVDGRLRYLPFADETHQRITVGLLDRLWNVGRGPDDRGVVMFGGFRVRTPRGFRAPDLLYLRAADDPRRGNRPRSETKWWEGADMICEIVSPAAPELDLVEKRREYAAAGISEYWIVDPRPGHRRIAVLVLEGGAYRGEFVDEGGVVESTLLPGFTLAVAECLDPE